MKICSSCKEEKELELFRNHKLKKDGKNYQCKDCEKKQKQEYYLKNKEKICEKNKAYRNTENGKKSLKKRSKTMILSGKRKECSRKHYLKNVDKIKQQSALYKLTEYGRSRLYLLLRERRALKKSTSDGTITYESLEKLKIDQDNKCKYCNNALDFKTKRAVHLDHIIPLSKHGVHSITNVAWSCASCNLKKSANII